jgi:hypothetical protein
MIVRRPITSHIDKHNPYTTILHFERGENIKFYMRGAIGWPEGTQEGFAIMAGQDIASGTIIIFEQFKFWTISHWLEQDGSLRKRDDGPGYHTGLIQFMQDCESRYKCCSYFYGGQHIDVIKRHGREVYDHKMVPSRIELIEVPYVSEVGNDLIRSGIKLKKFRGQHDSPLAKSVEQWVGLQAAGTGDNNAIHALRCLLAGYEFQPWVKLGVYDETF